DQRQEDPGLDDGRQPLPRGHAPLRRLLPVGPAEARRDDLGAAQARPGEPRLRRDAQGRRGPQRDRVRRLRRAMTDTRMSTGERESFLSDVRVGVVSIADGPRGPLTVPVWYGYERGGEVWFVTGRDSRKGKRLLLVDRISLCVQTETPPYKYLSVEGPIAGIE